MGETSHRQTAGFDQDAYIAKFDTDGNALWVRHLTGRIYLCSFQTFSLPTEMTRMNISGKRLSTGCCSQSFQPMGKRSALIHELHKRLERRIASLRDLLLHINVRMFRNTFERRSLHIAITYNNPQVLSEKASLKSSSANANNVPPLILSPSLLLARQPSPTLA